MKQTHDFATKCNAYDGLVRMRQIVLSFLSAKELSGECGARRASRTFPIYLTAGRSLLTFVDSCSFLIFLLEYEDMDVARSIIL
jgi:hypothetical protein